MKLSEIKYKGPKLDKTTKKSIYELFDETINRILYTGSFRQCWIRRKYLAQHECIDHFEIRIIE